ncbi:hypothetical protein ASG19_13150 [Rhizobium sp. Leaf306]|uniref:hypothetical protein n=1 Tax=Rhizobium sp. Leaf306 TaxID=1736330 RepID=UPI000715EC5C|nr:hypothetical protein [Rhizobium sp. Leaf306]KQQ37270.1 hypothetical protein ASG19_13150 [Rhizobium sp. Leaf306]
MHPENRVQRYKDTIQILRADIEWLTTSGFRTQTTSNETLIAELELAAEAYRGLVEELVRPVG